MPCDSITALAPVNTKITVGDLTINRIRQRYRIEYTGQWQIQQRQLHLKSARIRRRIQHTEIIGQTAVNPRKGLALGFMLAHAPGDVGIVLQDGHDAATASQTP